MSNLSEIFNVFYYTPLAAAAIALFIVGIFLISAHRFLDKETEIVIGELIGQVKNGKKAMYASVYKFTAIDGIERICRSGISSSNMTTKPIGTPQKIRYRTENPNQAKVKNNSFLLLGVLCLIISVILAFVYFSSVDTSITSVLLLLVFLVYFAFRIFNRFDGKNITEKFQKMDKKKGFFESLEKNTQPITDEETFLGAESFKSEQSKYNAMLKKWMPVNYAIAFGMIFGSLYWTHDVYQFSQKAITTTGKIVAFKQGRSTSSDGRTIYTYAPIISYEVNGQKLEYTSKVSTSSPSRKTGEMVEIMYNPKNPTEAMIERGIMNYILEIILFTAGIAILIILWRIKKRI